MASYLSAAANALGCVANPTMQCREDAERTSLKQYFVPDSFVDWYQGQRKLLGFDPPMLTEIPIFLFAIPMVFAIVGSFILGKIGAMFGLFMLGISGKLKGDFAKIGFILVCIILISIVMFLLFYYFGPKKEVYNDFVGTQKRIGMLYLGFQNQTPPADESSYKLLNIQPLSVKQVGFVGPNEKDGVFDPQLGIQTEVRSGVSFFTLQIDYLEKKKDASAFDDVGIPTLLYRNGIGNLISKNGASISEVATQLYTYLFNPDLGASKNPVILYLHFLKTPDPIKKPGEYLEFLKKVSEALQPIHEYILKDAGDNFRRQKSEISLLHMALPTLEKKIILLSNADTSIFRNSQATGGALSPISDLDSFVNMRVYLDNPDDKLGVTQPISQGTAHAVIIPYDRILKMSDSEKSNFAMKGKSRFVIAMPLPQQNPTFEELKKLLVNTGVNAIPLNLIGSDPDPVNKIINLWTPSKPYYMLKQMMLQSYTKTVSPYG